MKRTQKVHKKSSKSQENVQMLPKVLSGLSFSTDPQNILKFLKRSSQPSKSSEAHQRYSRGPQSPQNVIKVLKIPCRQKFLKIHQMVLTKSSKVPKKVLKRSTRSHQKILRSSPMFWDPHVLRSSKSPQKLNKVLKKSRKCTKCTQGPQASGFQVIHKMSSNSSKGPHSLRSPQRSTKGIQDDLKVRKELSTSSKSCGPQTYSKGHQMVLTKSSNVSYEKNSKGPQEVIKKSRKCTNVTQVLSGLSFSTDPENVLKFIKRSSKPSKSSVVHKRYSRRPQCPQNNINVLKIPWSSKVPQKVIKWSSQSPQKFPKNVLKRSARSKQKFLKGSSMFWDSQVLRSSKSPQKVHKVLKKSRKCTNVTQGPLRPQVLK